MPKRLFITLAIIFLATGAMAQRPGAEISAKQHQNTVRQTSARQGNAAAGKKTQNYHRGALSEYVYYVQQLKDLEEEESDFFNREIFVISQEVVSNSDNHLGAKMQFFNCFNKPIRGIDVYFIPYNAQGNVQADAAGIDSMKVSCAGRISPGGRGESVFPKLFCNKDNQIAYLMVSHIVFTFFDDSATSYSGIDEVKKHYK